MENDSRQNENPVEKDAEQDSVAEQAAPVPAEAKRAPRGSRALAVTAIVISLVAIALSGFSLSQTLVAANEQQDADTTTSYTLYIGLNDKDANKQLITSDEAVQKAREICLEHVDGCTISQATGYWQSDGTVYKENTVVCVISGASQDQVNAIADEADDVFNQNTVLVQSTELQSYYR